MEVTHIITTLNDGGAEGVLYRLCIHDTSNQHTVISLLGEGKYGPLLRKAGVAVYCLNLPSVLGALTGLWRLWRLLYKNKPDVVQTWLYHADLLGGLLARLAGVHSVVWGIRSSTLERKGTILIAKLLAHLSHWVPARIAVCAQRAVAVHGTLGYCTDKMVVIPNGYDLSCFVPDQSVGQGLRAEWGIAEGVPLLGMVGRFDPQKDHANLLGAIALLKARGVDMRCVLVGTGLSYDNTGLMKQIEASDLEGIVYLLGQRSDIPAVMNALDIHVLSSSFGEAFPNVLAEAMACGTLCVTTDVGDAALIVGDTGWVVPPSDALALANTIEDALNVRQKSGWTDRKRHARDRIEQNFSLARMCKAYDQLWSEVRQ